MAIIRIDGKEYDIKKGQNLLHAGLSQGLDIPYFCWHPAMGSVGACRLCAVKQYQDEDDSQGKLVMACMTPAEDGSLFSLDDGEASQFRRAVLEWLMVNHPHDCPICDEGGECHLQDMTVMTGHTYREYRFNKRTYRNQQLGPFINHEMNRCIQCYRCVRFYNDYAGGDDLQALAAHDHVYFGRHEDGTLESEFSGNLVEVCPTGVFTDKTLKQHYTRKWDLQTAPSICVHCSLGCNTIPGERYGTLRRIRNRYNGAVNGYFLCDRGRYGYEFVNSERRIRQPLRRANQDDGHQPCSNTEAWQELQSILANSRGLIGLGSPRASLESNFALRRLVGPDGFFAGIPDREQKLISEIIQILQTGPARSPSLQDIQSADAVFVLGEDVANTGPMAALAVRQAVRQQPLEISRGLNIFDWQDAAVREAVQQEKGPLYIATPAGTRLDDVATQTYRATADDIARLGMSVAHRLADGAPAPPELPDEVQGLAQEIAQALREAERPVVISGSSLGSIAVIQAAANVAWALCRAERPTELSYLLPACNSLGLGLVGGGSLAGAKEALANGADTLIILENDLYRRAEAAWVDEMLGLATRVVVIDHLPHGTTAAADLVLPAATFAEGDGTLVNNEGRAQRFYQVYGPAGDVQASWRWLGEMAAVDDRPAAGPWQNLEEITAELVRSNAIFEPVPTIAPPPEFHGVQGRVPRQPHRYSGRTAMGVNISVHEPKPPADGDAPLAFSMEGFEGEPPPALINRFWAPGWNSVQAVNKFQSEVGGPLHGGDPGRRLIEPAEVEQVTFFDGIPQSFEARQDEWWVTPFYHVFGSEPLSLVTPGVAERAPKPYLAVNPADAARLSLRAGEIALLEIGGVTRHLPIKLEPSLPPGVAGLPAGSLELAGLSLPGWAKISPQA